jgi:predicted transcriptional regulator
MRELHVIANLTNNIDRKIVQSLLKQEKYTFRDIVTPIHKSPSTVSWYLSVRYNNGHGICNLKNKLLSSILAESPAALIFQVTNTVWRGSLRIYRLAL